MAQTTQVDPRARSVVGSLVPANLLVWAGVLPFFLFAILFMLWPSSSLILDSFQDAAGHFTFKNIIDLFTPSILNSYLLSIRISFVTAIIRNLFHVNIYEHGFNLYSFSGLALTYMYFQFPLMVLIIAPSLDGLKREWRGALENLGARSWRYWRHIALPILLPSLLGTMILLFGNSFGAYATAYALTGGSLNLITIQIGNQISGNVLYNPNLGYALALGMIVIMSVSIGLYTWLQRRTARWLR